MSNRSFASFKPVEVYLHPRVTLVLQLLEQLEVSRRKAEALEAEALSASRHLNVLLSQSQTDSAAVVRAAMANSRKSADLRILDSEIAALNREVSIKRQEVQRVRSTAANRRQASTKPAIKRRGREAMTSLALCREDLIAECEMLMLKLRSGGTEEASRRT
ncbi:hypothetical protein Efla_003904 [Eimeria flavescens]